MPRLANIRIKSIIIFILVVPLLKPEGLSELSPFADAVIYDYGLYIDSAIIFLWFVISLARRRKISFVLICVFAFVLYEALNTVIQGGSLYNLAASWLKILLAGMLIECCIDDFKPLIASMYIYLFVLLSINLVLVLMFPNGMFVSSVYYGFDTNWLLGFKSSLQYYVFPLIVISALYSHYSGKRFQFIFVLILCHTETVLVRNTMLLVGLLIFDLLVILVYLRKRSVSYAVQVPFIGALNFVFIFFGELAMKGEGFLSWLILGILGKSTTIYSRIAIWDTVIYRLSDSWLFGLGVLSDETRMNLIGTHAHAHNQMLQVVFESGVVGLLLFLLIFAVLVRTMYGRKDFSTEIIKCFTFALFVMVVFEIFTRAPAAFIRAIIFLGYYSDRLNCQMMTQSRE